MLTINGRIHLRRRQWHGPATGTVAPLDAVVGIATATVSLGVRELMCRLNRGTVSFREAAANLARAAQLDASPEQVRRLVEAEGRQVLGVRDQGRLAAGWTAADCRTPEGKTRVYFSTDGVTVPMVREAQKQKRRVRAVAARRRRPGHFRGRPLPPRKRGATEKSREFKLVAFYSQDRQHCLAVGTKGRCRAAGLLMSRWARWLNVAQADEKPGNVDGAPWIVGQTQQRQLPLDGLNLDLYHLSTHVHAARREVFGEASVEGQVWAGQRLHTVVHAGDAPFWQELVAWRASLRSPRKRQAADQLLHYVSERREMLLYPQFRARGWDIGSGPMEAICKTATSRLKGRGRRWDADNAEAVMALDCLEHSHQWPSYWQTQLAPAA